MNYIVEGICNIVMGNFYLNSDRNQGNNFEFWDKSKQEKSIQNDVQEVYKCIMLF